MKRIVRIVCVVALLSGILSLKAAFAAGEEKPRIQIAILLDTSGSMSGLIEQAKAQLWKIVNEFIGVRREGKIPELEVALYEYGKSSIPAEEGYLRMILPLTTDLDKVSEELFALRTNGGQEYCGKVIGAATEGLLWSESNDDYKAIFIAGNEPFTQGDVDYRNACPATVAKGIIINTIFCGAFDEGVSTNWKDGSALADGTYMNIDHNQEAVHIAAPQDKEIAALGVELNKTYIPYGSEGKFGAANQGAQDANAEIFSSANAAQRAIAKASFNYRNANWDLVDALREEKVNLENIKMKDLPEKMQKMTPEQRKAYVEANAKQRKETQEKINRLNEERRKYVAEKMKDLKLSGKDTLDAVIIATVREQVVKKNFEIE